MTIRRALPHAKQKAMKNDEHNLAQEMRFAKSLCGNLPKASIRVLKELLRRSTLSVMKGDVIYLDGGWYVTHSGLVRLANRRRCNWDSYTAPAAVQRSSELSLGIS